MAVHLKRARTDIAAHSLHSSSSSLTMNTHNDIQLTREILFNLLNDLQQHTLHIFGCQIRLFIHGGAVMLLHPHLSASSTRRTTRDIDYIRRAFGHEWRKKGVYDAEDRLQSCINATAHKFHVGTDWMNADPDVALPFARDPRGHIYDPIYYDSKQPNNIDMNTVYSSPGLVLISVTMFWGVALKLVRYKKEDPVDIVAMLRHGTKLNGVQWTPQIMENWIKALCWPMGYDNYQPQRIDELRDRVQDAVRLLQNSSDDFTSRKSYAPMRKRRPSMHALNEHRMQNLHSHSFAPPRIESLSTSFDRTVVPHHSASHIISPLSSPTDSVRLAMPEPWFPHAPVIPQTRAF
ncbi:hypothetical protein EV363DRAFT_1336935 [Boletus edulis]|nr:hypothetical protein EV363DRAFT_1336935 [Boletus edulis]